MTTLVLGEGLLGAAVRRALGGDGAGVSRRVEWADTEVATRQLGAEVSAHLDRHPSGWGVAWCAGSGFVGADAAGLAAETRCLAAVLDAVAAHPAARAGRFFLASSAGGVHGAGSTALITEATPTTTVSAYGAQKVEQEALVGRWAADLGLPALVGRISNLYGPEQYRGRRQGFVSHLAHALLERRPLILNVPAATQRDFVHVDDVATRVAFWCSAPAPPGPVTKLLVAGRSHSLARVVWTMRACSGVQPRLVHAVTPVSGLQPAILRFESQVEVGLDRRVPARALEVGVKEVWLSLLREHARGRAA